MATQGPNSPGTLADDAAVGSTAWTNPTNAGASDDARATAGGPTGPSHYLKATNFGFTIPAGATINGVEVSIERSAASAAPGVTDNVVSLVKGGAVSGNNKAAGGNWPTTDAAASYGGGADLWGLTLTDSDVNASNFGVVVSANMANNTARIDHITITITYTAAATPVQVTAKQVLRIDDSFLQGE